MRERKRGSTQGFLRPRHTVIWHTVLYHTLLAKASPKGTPDPRGGEMDFIIWWEEPPSHMTKGADTGRDGESGPFFPSDWRGPHQRANVELEATTPRLGQV